MSNGLKYLHSRDIVHGDLKSVSPTPFRNVLGLTQRIAQYYDGRKWDSGVNCFQSISVSCLLSESMLQDDALSKVKGFIPLASKRSSISHGGG